MLARFVRPAARALTAAPIRPAPIAVRPLTTLSALRSAQPAEHHQPAHDPAADQPWPTKKRVPESWEPHFIGGMAICFFAIYVVSSWGPDTSLDKWAREEAIHTGFKAPEPAADLQD